MKTTKIRNLLRYASSPLSFQLIYKALNEHRPDVRRTIRSCVNKMVKTGEVRKLSSGLFVFNHRFEFARPAYVRIWRLIRTKKPGWSYKEIAMLAGVSHPTVRKYCKQLEEQGYIVRHGKKGKSFCFKATQKAIDSPRPPKIPIEYGKYDSVLNQVLYMAWFLVEFPNCKARDDELLKICNGIVEAIKRKEE